MDWVCRYNPSRDPHDPTITEVFSTITSPIFSKLVIVCSDMWIFQLHYEVVLFQALRKMHKVRPFELVLLFEGPDSVLSEGLEGL